MNEEIDYKTAYENVMVAYNMLKKENKEIKEGTRPVISPYHGDAYITHEMEYHARKRLEQENKELHNKIDKLEEYSRGNIEACENRLKSPFCNFEKVTKELMIHKNYLEILKDSDVDE